MKTGVALQFSKWSNFSNRSWRSAFNFVPNHMTDYYEVFTGSSTGLGCDLKCYDLRNYYMNVKAVFGDSNRINCAQLLLSTSCRATV